MSSHSTSTSKVLGMWGQGFPPSLLRLLIKTYFKVNITTNRQELTQKIPEIAFMQYC